MLRVQVLAPFSPVMLTVPALVAAPVAAPLVSPVAVPVFPADPLSSGPRARAVLEAEEARYAEIVARDQAARARLLDVSAVAASVSHSGCTGSRSG